MSFNIFIWNFKIGGVQKHTVLLANYLVSKSWDVQLLCASMEGDLLSMLDSRVKTLTYRIPNTNNPLRLIRLYFRLKKVLPKSSIVLCNGPNNFRQIGRINLWFKHWNLLYILQNDLEFKKGWGSYFKQLEINLICNDSRSHIVALSKKQKRDHEKRLGIKRLEVIPNFIDFDHTYLTKLNRSSPRGVSIGRYANQKGYDILLESMKQVDENIQIDVYGFGLDERLKLESKAKEYGLKNIIFNGPILNIYDVISKYDYFVLSSRYEPFGIVVAEALSCGLPVVSTDCDGPLDIINEENGIVVKKNDVNLLATGLESINDKIMGGLFHPEKIRDSASIYSLKFVAERYLKYLNR